MKICAPLKEMQERTLRRTQLLKLKAEAELSRLEKSPSPDPGKKGDDASSGKDEPPDAAGAKPRPVDPKQVKAGYQKAIELAPRPSDQMERAVGSLKKNDSQAAYPAAEEARKILEEIQKAQPKQDPPDQKKQDQDKKNDDQQKKDQKDQQKDDQQKKEQQKDDQEKKDQQKKDQEQKKQEEPRMTTKDDQKQPQPQISAIASKRPCARSANASRKNANETAR